MSEKEYIIHCYKTYFSHLRDKKTVIYGIGKNTGIILENFDHENIVGLMDECRTGECIYGKEIITMEEAADRGTQMIIIVARAGNVRIIYRRISEACVRLGIKVYDINGDEITSQTAPNRDYSAYKSITFENLKGKIDRADVISFDIFDTLVMRDVLYPRDIFSLVEKTAGRDFRRRRIRGETDLYAQGRNPRLREIYDAIGGDFSPEDELRTEKEHLHCRESGCRALKYALSQGKEVYFVTDMYLDAAFLEELLRGLDISVRRERILVSCEFGVSKHNGLFGVLRKRVGDRKILHIGDNMEADIDAAGRYGIDDAFYIPGALNMLEDSWGDSLLECAESLEDRLVIGKLLVQAFSDGFLFARSQGKLEVSCNRQIGSIFIAPFICRFYGWMLREARKRELSHILLAARDGWIIERIYSYFEGKGLRQPRMDYFYVSRSVAVLAGIRDDEDICHGCRLAFNGSDVELLKSRFRLTDDEICRKKDRGGQEYVLMHREAILKSAREMRGRFRKYIDSLCGKDRGNVGFFDFISSGTCQKALVNIVDFHVTGLYVGNVNNETEYKPEIDISSMFGEGSCNVFKKGYWIVDNYFLLESILTSEEATLVDFDRDGRPILGRESRTDRQLKELRDIQDGVMEYIKEMSLKADEMVNVNLNLVDRIFGLLNEETCVVQTDYFREHHLEDEFCNREFDLSLPQ